MTEKQIGQLRNAYEKERERIDVPFEKMIEQITSKNIVSSSLRP